MTVLATDNFNRANSADLGANWTPFKNVGFSIVSNQAQATDEGSDQAEEYTAISWPNDQYGQCKLIGLTVGDPDQSGYGITLRRNGTNYYRIVVNGAAGTGCSVAKVVSNAYTLLTQVGTWVNGDILRVELQGNTLRVYKNGVQQGGDIAGDAAIATGNVGIFYSSTNSGNFLDDFEGGDFGAAADTQTRRYQIRRSRMTSW